MIIGGVGGANTKTGLHYEKRVDFATLIARRKGYSVENENILYKGKVVAQHYKKTKLYKYLLSKGIYYLDYVSYALQPDNAVFVFSKGTFYIIEVKFQKVGGSVDEKLQTCDFKIKQYRKLLQALKVRVEYIYVLNDWFTSVRYRDVLNYITSIEGCSFVFNELPLKKIGLPIEA